MPKRTDIRLTKTAIENSTNDLRDSEIRGFGVRITPGGKKSFFFQFRTKSGQQGRIAIGQFPDISLDQARKIARKHLLAVEEGRNPSAERRASRVAADVSDLLEVYCEYGIQKGLKAQYLKDVRRMVSRYALPMIGKVKIKDVTTSDVRRVHHAAKEGSGRYAANRLRAFLSKMFSLAISDDLRKDNPCKGVDRYPEDQRWTYLGEQQVCSLLAACDAHQDQSAANAVRILLFSGARLREVLNATWDQFDLTQGTWVKPSHHTKTKIRHQVQLADHLTRLLKSMLAESDSPFLFPGRDGTKPRADLKGPWAKLLKEAGLSGFCIHDLRRTTASFILSTGSDLAVVGRTLGHTQQATTARYAQLFEGAQRAGINRAIERMQGPISVAA